MMIDDVFVTATIDAYEGRKLVTINIPEAFLQADIDEDIIMLLTGELAELMVMIEPS